MASNDSVVMAAFESGAVITVETPASSLISLSLSLSFPYCFEQEVVINSIVLMIIIIFIMMCFDFLLFVNGT